MRIPVDPGGESPMYRQIEEFLRQSIISGTMAPETRLPATRRLARDLGINRITVQNAYAELEADGLIFTRTGSGTYVLPPLPLAPIPKSEPDAPWPLWQLEAVARSGLAHSTAPDELLRAARHPHPISLAGGCGDSRLFPAEDYRRVIQSVLRRDGVAAMEYGDHAGYLPLRSTIAQILTSQGIPARPENLLITAGSQQALALVTQMLLRPGDAVVAENPTYAIALDLFRALGLKIVGVPMDASGMQVDKLEKVLQQHHPKLVYTIPNFHNPTGSCMSVQRRRQLIALSDRYNIPILEDDYVGDLRYEGRAQPALKSIDPGGRVLYVSTFSKMLMPGLRVGFLAAEGPFYESLVKYKRVNDLTTSSLHQRALEAYVTVGRYQSHLRRTSLIYRKRRDALICAVDRYLPAAISLDPPQGGLFAWMRLPGDLSAETLLLLACKEGVAFAPGGAFFPQDSDGDHYLRLNFVSQPPEETEEGIKRLGKAIKRLEVSSRSVPHS
ncbi:MAG TPA: PLP-dependent aminotransferase family protein [Acidobacteriota bacterium]|nr:PLP-dependent aminotransferase family protein [Acidobacteriota bacterium]